MSEILSILLFLGIIGLISFLITKLITWIVPGKLKSKKHYSIIIFSISFILVSVTIFFYISSLTMRSPNFNVGGSRIDRLVSGKIAYQIPDTMDVGDNYKAVASVSKSENDSILFQNIDSTGFEKEIIKISSRVKMILIDPTGYNNFQITPLNSEEQLVDDSTNTIWQWNVTPLRSGENELILRTTVKVLDELGENYKDIPVFEKRVKVNASLSFVTKQFIGDYWQWLTTVIIIPLIVWGYRRINIKNKADKQRSQIGFRANGNKET